MTGSEKGHDDRPQTPILRAGQVRIKGKGSLSSWVWRAKAVVLTERALVTASYKIPLSQVSKIERVDSKPYCLLLEAKDRRYYLSFDNDGELYDWQEDVYSRSPLGTGQPFGFIHNIHIGGEGTSDALARLPPEWSEALRAHHLNVAIPPPTGITGVKKDTHHKRFSQAPSSSAGLSVSDSPVYKAGRNRRASEPPPQLNSQIVLDGQHLVREDGGFTSWMWRHRRLVLGPQTLTIYKSQGPVNSIVIKLRDITGIERSGTRPYCLVIETSLHKRYFFSFTSDEELYNWQDAIYSRSRLGGISNPANFVHNIHIGIDEVSGALTGVPDQWKPILSATL